MKLSTTFFKMCLRFALDSLLFIADRILPPLEPSPPLLKSAATPTPEQPAPTLEPKPESIYIGDYPVGSHAAMFVTPEFAAGNITELVIQLPPAPNDALVAIADVLTLAPGRAKIVEALLDEAWMQGRTTYSALIEYVKQQSGQGCSKKTVSAWKKSRMLIEAPEAVAA